MVWIILYVTAGVALFLYWNAGKNAVWGSATFALIIGIAIMIFSDYGWIIIAKSAATGAIIGAIFEFIPNKKKKD